MKEKSTYGIDPERLACLLAIGVEAADGQNNPSSTRSPAEVLREMLGSPPPLDPSSPDSLPVVLNRPCDEMTPVAGQCMRDLLLSPETDLSVIETLRDYGKGLSSRHESNTESAAGAVMYHAATANALVFHGRNITPLSFEKLTEAYENLAQTQWLPAELRKLFRKVRVACRKRPRK